MRIAEPLMAPSGVLVTYVRTLHRCAKVDTATLSSVG